MISCYVFCQCALQLMCLFFYCRHHCRSCGGVFCDKCTQYELQVPGSFDPYRCCPGCWRGEMPGDQLKEKITHILELRGDRKGAVLKPARSLTLTRGEKYLNVPASDVPSSGYLEFVNKLPEGGGGGKVCCLKVIYGGGDTKFEAPRPSYIAGKIKLLCVVYMHIVLIVYLKLHLHAVPPGEVVHCTFPSDTSFLELLVLFGNTSHGLAHVFETRAENMTADRISNSAKVSLFPYVAAYKVKVTDKNVFLKYKGDGNVSVRAGNNVSRIGLAGKLTRSKKRTSQMDSLDFATNISAIEKLFQY